MIILSDDIIFRKAVIHLLNVELGKFAPAQDLFMMQPDVIELVRKQVCYLLNSDELKAADWNTKEPVFQKLEQMNEKDDKSFIQTSAYLADRLFDIMCDSVEIPSADLLCLSFQTNQEIYYALIKLNYQNSFMHELMKYDNEEIISNIRHKKILPLGKRISEGIIFNLSLQKVMLKEKKYEMLNGDKIYYLTERFLRSIAQTEAKRKYQILSRTIKTINKKYPEDGLDDGAEDVDVTDDDVEFTPTVAEKGGKLKLNINFKSTGKYAKFQTIQTTVDVIDPDEEDVALKTAKKVNVSVEASDVLQKYSIHLIKTDQDGKKLAGAEFALKAKTDIVNGKGNTIFKKGDTIATAISQDDQFEYLEFIGLPTDIYAKDGTGCEMYEVVETSAPAGYEGNDKKLTLKGEVINNTKENLIHDVKAENNTDNATSTYIHDSDTFVNQKSEYIALKKIWDDNNDAAKIRPTSITIKATHKTTGDVKMYTLTKENNWTTFTDIKKDDKDNWKFTEDVPQGYQSKDPVWDGVNYVVTFTNVHDNPGRVDINVQKVWEDGSDADGIRVKAIKVTLYQNGEAYGKPIELNASNNWSDNTTFHNLDKYDKAGEEINYEIKEEVFDGLTGDAKTGYMDSYETNETTDADGTTTKNIIITNTHTPETTQKKVKKIWNDNGNKDGIRPKSVSVNLLADGKVEESFTLSSENNWQAKSKLLPVKVNGKKVNYTWEEVKEDLITGESEIGYKPTYDTDANDADLTLITNTHDRTQPKGKVTITKALDPGNLNMDVGDPSFTFTLSGTDVYGKKHSYEKQIKFTKAEVEKQMKDHPGDSIELSVTFDDLEYGTYTCNEGGMLKYFKLNSLTSDSSNATLDQDKGTVTFDIGPAGTTAKAQLEGTAKFINQMIQGSVKLIKKDSNGRVLKDVEFVIQSSDGAEVAKAKTDAAGEVTFDGLIPDTYTITETKTKEGKTLLKEPITITLPLTMSQAEVDKNNVDTNKAIKQGSNYYFYHLTYEVTNDSRLDLPKTGGWIDYLPLAGGMILILGGLFVYYRKKRRKM